MNTAPKWQQHSITITTEYPINIVMVIGGGITRAQGAHAPLNIVMAHRYIAAQQIHVCTI